MCAFLTCCPSPVGSDVQCATLSNFLLPYLPDRIVCFVDYIGLVAERRGSSYWNVAVVARERSHAGQRCSRAAGETLRLA